jgi:hypothetical protein
MRTSHGLTTDGMIAMSDVDLLVETYHWIAWVEDDVVSDALYFCVQEMAERFAPGASEEELRRSYLDDVDGRGFPSEEWDDALAWLKRRQAARLIRETFADGDDG